MSRPPNKETYGPALWVHILRDQLSVDEAVFWACVNDGVVPDRGGRKPSVDALPADVVHLLKIRLHLSDQEIRALSKDEAIERLKELWEERP